MLTIPDEGDEHVRRLDVAVHEASRMSGVERLADLGEERDGSRRIERALGLQQGAEICALDVAHGDVEDAPRLPRVVDRDDVWMVDRRSQPRLAMEALAEALVLRQLRSKQLEGDLALEREILGEVDDAHAAPADDRVEAVAGELPPEQRVSPDGPRHTHTLVRGRADRHKPGEATTWLREPARRQRRRCGSDRRGELQDEHEADPCTLAFGPLTGR